MIPQRRLLRTLGGLLVVASVGLLLLATIPGWAQPLAVGKEPPKDKLPPKDLKEPFKDKKFEKGTEAEIKAAKEELDKAQKEVVKLSQKLAKLQGKPPEIMIPGGGGKTDERLNLIEKKLDTILKEIIMIRSEKGGLPKDKKPLPPDKSSPSPAPLERSSIEPSFAPEASAPARQRVEGLPANRRL